MRDAVEEMRDAVEEMRDAVEDGQQSEDGTEMMTEKEREEPSSDCKFVIVKEKIAKLLNAEKDLNNQVVSEVGECLGQLSDM